MKKTKSRCFIISGVGLCSALIWILMLSLWSPNSAQGFEPGKTYDKNNYQEIEGLLIDAIKDWVKKGDDVYKNR